MKKIALLVGARLNYMKVAPLWRIIKIQHSEDSPSIFSLRQETSYRPQPLCLRLSEGF